MSACSRSGQRGDHRRRGRAGTSGPGWRSGRCGSGRRAAGRRARGRPSRSGRAPARCGSPRRRRGRDERPGDHVGLQRVERRPASRPGRRRQQPGRGSARGRGPASRPGRTAPAASRSDRRRQRASACDGPPEKREPQSLPSSVCPTPLSALMPRPPRSSPAARPAGPSARGACSQPRPTPRSAGRRSPWPRSHSPGRREGSAGTIASGARAPCSSRPRRRAEDCERAAFSSSWPIETQVSVTSTSAPAQPPRRHRW